MKIYLIAPYQESPSISMHVYAQNLCREYLALWHETEIISYPALKTFLGKRMNDILTRYVMYPWKLFTNSFRKEGVFHIVDHSYSYLTLFLRGKKVVTCHDLIPIKFKEHVGRLGYTLFRRNILCLKYATRIISDSESTKKDLLEVIGGKYADRIVTVPLGYNEAIFFPKDATQHETVNNAENKKDITSFKILMVGKHFYKNVAKTLQGLALLPTDIKKQIELIKVLDFTEEEELFVKENLQDITLRVYSRVKQDDIWNLYREADMLLFASMYEGFGMPIVEAMACGTPVITSNCASMPEAGGDAALYVDPNSAQDIAKKIEQMYIDHTLRNSLIQKWLERAKLFTWKTVGAQALSNYPA